MAVNAELTEFVRNALGRGLPRADVDATLRRAGWTQDAVRNTLDGYADVEFPIPVPRPKPYLSAREAFLYLLLFSMLYFSAYNFGVLVFEYINRAFPDAAELANATYTRASIRWALSSLAVSFPVFMYLSLLTERSVRSDPAKRRSQVRRWLMYLTTFVAASVLIGDFMVVIYNTLEGGLTARFVLKVLTIAAIGGTALVYYLADLRLEDTGEPHDNRRVKRIIAGATSLAVAVAGVAAIGIIGSPATERARRLDDKRIADLQNVSASIDTYFRSRKQLPATIADAGQERREALTEIDPLGTAYEYRPTGSDKYGLCATFNRDSSNPQNSFWAHPAGRHCFALTARNRD